MTHVSLTLLTGLQDAVNEVIPRDGTIVVGIHLAEEVGHSGLLVVHELHKLCKEIVENMTTDKTGVKVFNGRMIR